MLKIFNKKNEIENEINSIMPKLNFLFDIIKDKNNFLTKMKEEIKFEKEILKLPQIFLFSILIIPLSPLFLFSKKYNFNFFLDIYVKKFLFTKKILKHNEKVFLKYEKKLIKYNSIVENKIEHKNFLFNIDDFYIYEIQNDIFEIFNKEIKKLVDLYNKDETRFLNYYNSYSSVKKEEKDFIIYVSNILRNEISNLKNNNKEGKIINSKDRFTKNDD